MQVLGPFGALKQRSICASLLAVGSTFKNIGVVPMSRVPCFEMYIVDGIIFSNYVTVISDQTIMGA